MIGIFDTLAFKKLPILQLKWHKYAFMKLLCKLPHLITVIYGQPLKINSTVLAIIKSNFSLLTFDLVFFEILQVCLFTSLIQHAVTVKSYKHSRTVSPCIFMLASHLSFIIFTVCTLNNLLLRNINCHNPTNNPKQPSFI